MDATAWTTVRHLVCQLPELPPAVRAAQSTNYQIQKVMANAKTYLAKIRKQVKADNGGKVPERLELTIERYAKALAKLDKTEETMDKDGYSLTEVGSMGQMVTKQHPLYNLSLQLESVCQQYAKMLGLTAAKAAVKTEDQAAKTASSSLDEFIDGIKG